MGRADEVVRGTFSYSVNVDGSRAPGDFTPRIAPVHPAASSPLEIEQILWYR